MTDPKIMIPMIMNTTLGIHPGTIISAGRQSGKSYYQKQILNAMYNGHNVTLGTEPMKEPKHKFSRANWYEADHRYDDYNDVIAWCTEHFGPRPRYPDAWTRWCDIHIDRIRFRDEKDYAWFILRWS